MTLELDLTIADSCGNTEADILIEALQLCRSTELTELRNDANVLAEGNPDEMKGTDLQAIKDYLFRIERTGELIRRLQADLNREKANGENIKAYEQEHATV